MRAERARHQPQLSSGPVTATLALLLCGFLASGTSLCAESNSPSKTNSSEAVGTILPRGVVSLNGVPTLPNSSVYLGDTLYTSPGSLATVVTSDGGKVQVWGGSEVVIARDARGITLNLKRGVLEVQSPAGQDTAVVAEEVRAGPREGLPAAFRFDHSTEDIRVTAYRGIVEISGLAGGSAFVSAGQIAWLVPQQDAQIKPQPPYPAGAGTGNPGNKEKRENARQRYALYLLLAAGAAAGIAAAVVLATQSDPRP